MLVQEVRRVEANEGWGRREAIIRSRKAIKGHRFCVLPWALRPCINSLSPGGRRKTTPKPSETPPCCPVSVHGRAMSAYERRQAEPFNGNVKCDMPEPEEERTRRSGTANTLTKRHTRATMLFVMLLAIVNTFLRRVSQSATSSTLLLIFLFVIVTVASSSAGSCDSLDKGSY